MRSAKRLIVALAIVFLAASPGRAHPLLTKGHDRYLTVRLRNGRTPGTVAISISYRLDANEMTIVEDMLDYRDEVDAGLFARKPLEYYDHYTRIFADILARNLQLKVNGQVVSFRCTQRGQTLRDEETREPLGHLRCNFIFAAELPVKADAENELRLRENNFGTDLEGEIHFKLINNSAIKLTHEEVPDPKLNKLHLLKRPFDFDAKLRTMILRFGKSTTSAAPAADNADLAPARDENRDHDHDEFLAKFRELMDSGAGLWLILLVFAGLGAAHALTPGHGKTLVAAYLVGEHGTVWHALILGLTTTITHTGVVLIIAAVLYFLPETMSGHARQAIQTGLGLVLGISVTCLGIWLFLQRLSGRADHIHIGGGHDHHHLHHHGPAPSKAAGEKRPLRLGGIIILGMNGGLIPCWDAVAILAAVAGSREFWLALPALLAFSAGLAGVLVAIGILVVQFRSFAGSKWGEGQMVRILPFVSAVLVTGMGIFLCWSSMKTV